MRILVASITLIFFCSVARAQVGKVDVLPFDDSRHSAIKTRPYAPLHLSSDRFPPTASKELLLSLARGFAS